MLLAGVLDTWYKSTKRNPLIKSAKNITIMICYHTYLCSFFQPFCTGGNCDNFLTFVNWLAPDRRRRKEEKCHKSCKMKSNIRDG